MGSRISRSRGLAGIFLFAGVVVVLMLYRQQNRVQSSAVPRTAVHYDRAVAARAIAALVAAGVRDSATQEVVATVSENAALPVGPQYKERPAGEWDGMLVDMTVQPECVDEMPCGLARACVNGKCAPCETDSDCRQGEGCVLDHCLISKMIQCRSSKQCATNATCILSGYSGDVRGNGEMISKCVAPTDSFGNKPPARPAPPFGTPESESSRNKGFADEIRRARGISVDQ
jgi:hypothetical protein